jgi:hypothetical protein
VAFIFRHPERDLGFLGDFATWREIRILLFSWTLDSCAFAREAATLKGV